MSEMVQELGVALGVALLGSLAALLYRVKIANVIPDGVSPEVSTALGESLWATMVISDQISAGLLEQAQAAFTQGMNMAATVSGVAFMALAFMSVVTLRHVEVIGEERL